MTKIKLTVEIEEEYAERAKDYLKSLVKQGERAKLMKEQKPDLESRISNKLTIRKEKNAKKEKKTT